MTTVTRRLRVAASPLVAAVALGLVSPAVLSEEEDESGIAEPDEPQESSPEPSSSS